MITLVWRIAFLTVLFLGQLNLLAQELWHNQSREMRYQPDGKGFVINNGKLRFNRALYGSNTAFRVEAGDQPEFSLYLPGMGGNLHLGVSQGNQSKWLTQAKKVVARYEAGAMSYTITDPMLGKGILKIRVLALSDGDGMILKISGEQIPSNIKLHWAFGGATGKKFSRDGDLGADPESVFYLKPEYCADNEYEVQQNSFQLYFGSGRYRSVNERYENNYQPTAAELEQTRLQVKKRLFGLFPENSELKIGDAAHLKNPLESFNAGKSAQPILSGKLQLESGKELFGLIVNPDTHKKPVYSELPGIFAKADSVRQQLADRVKIETPDPYINAAGASLSTAADAIWDGNSFMHGAIAWRMPLNGWRGAYAADWLGWHDRAERHFDGYFKAQYTEPASGPSVPDSATNLARQQEKIGTALFTDGYISRSPGKINNPHHYDMNLVFIDQLLSHFAWTGDLAYVEKSWPVLVKHLAWEKRNFDANDDGLYDAYCCIWASDALQYSGGGVTHSSAYNYRANKMVAELAVLLGKDPKPYQEEAEKIKKAVNEQLWLTGKGWFAENKDLLGNQLVHPSAALWTVYHAIDEGLADQFQAWLCTKYVDNSIPHIPVRGKGMPAGEYHTLSTTNWMPYSWSINNVASGEVLHTALAYWQTGRSEEAFKFTKSLFLDFMFLGSSPGNFGQLSFYDAFRGELYRDFADGIGTAARALVEGLFGISPDLLNNKMTIRPGWPAEWPFAKIETPDLKIQFKRNGSKEMYQVETRFKEKLTVVLQLKARSDAIKMVTINGFPSNWKLVDHSIGIPELQIITGKGSNFELEIEWEGKALEILPTAPFYAKGTNLRFDLQNATILKVYDPQEILGGLKTAKQTLLASVLGELGGRSTFVQLQQGAMRWWQPLSFELRNPVKAIQSKIQSTENLAFTLQNNSDQPAEVQVSLRGFQQKVTVKPRSASPILRIPKNNLVPGSNQVKIQATGGNITENMVNWSIKAIPGKKYEPIELSQSLNDRITNIFKPQYYAPRSPYPTLSIPIQGIGDWCSFKETEVIDDSGLRKIAGSANRISSPQGIPFAVSGKELPNILFTSKWDNYPDSVMLNLTGKASHLYLLMAGSGHHMQSRMTNGVVRVEYEDGSTSELPLVSPDNWWPIEQDFYEDGYAFKVDAVRPVRLYLKTGAWHADTYNSWSKNKTKKIEGGAASLLDLPLDPAKELRQLTLVTLTNDVVIGLMAATLVR